MQDLHCRTPNGRQAFNAKAMINPTKMLCPHLLTGIEQWYTRAGQWITCHNFIAFVAIADRTRQPQIGLRVISTARQRNDMFDLQTRHNQMLWTQTVATPLPGYVTHATVYFR